MAGPGGLFDCPGLSNDELIEVFEANPGRLREAIAGLSEEDLRATPVAGKWSIQEITLHVIDTEIMAAARIRQTITDSERTFSYWDQEVWADSLEYRQATRAEVEEALALYGSLRRGAGYLLRRLPADVWQRIGVHKRRGVEVTLRQLVDHHTVHSEQHIGQILERRKLLGKGISMAPLVMSR